MGGKYLIGLVLIGLSSFARAGEQFQSWPEACSAASAFVAEGDLIFLDIPNALFRRVAEGTNSWTSHVGIVFKGVDGGWMVAESTVPTSKETPLCTYLRKSSKYKFEIKRYNRRLTEDEIDLLHAAANSYLRRFYTFGFNFDSSRLFCSKFVYLAYQAIGIEVGSIQTFRELLVENPNASLNFWRLWFLGRIPWSRRTVTPASQLNDPKFETIFEGE